MEPFHQSGGVIPRKRQSQVYRNKDGCKLGSKVANVNILFKKPLQFLTSAANY